tara:strand:- start:9700 stop:9876 length:177 start_codon:yes stop_codon:yes gene_type:complete
LELNLLWYFLRYSNINSFYLQEHSTYPSFSGVSEPVFVPVLLASEPERWIVLAFEQEH